MKSSDSQHLNFSELKRRTGDEKGAAMQALVNEKFKEAVTRVQKRKYKELQ